MYRKLESGELKKLMASMKLSSVLIQLTFLAFPLSMYIIYNKIIASNNSDTILIVVIFLVCMLLIQLTLKTIETIQKNVLKTDHQIKSHEKYIDNKLNSKLSQNNITSNQNQYDIAEISNITNDTNNLIQKNISNAYYWFLVIYFILVLVIGKFIVVVPLFFFSISYIISKKITLKYNETIIKYNIAFNEKTLFTKEALQKINIIKNLNIDKQIHDKYIKTNRSVSTYRVLSLYLKNLLLKISMIMNMVNIAFILIIGRYLYGIGLATPSSIITCSLITMCVSRTLGQIFTNLQLEPDTEIKDNPDIIDQEVLPEDYLNSQYANIKNELKKSPIVICKSKYINDNNSYDIDFKSLYLKLSKEYAHEFHISYINKTVKLFYGNILDNITLFNPDKYGAATQILKTFHISKIISNLPFQLNYVITGDDDESIPYELKIAIEVARELLNHPDIIIFDMDHDEISNEIKVALLDYIKINNIKLIFKKYNYNLNNIGISNQNLIIKEHEQQ